jgi:hypothetical protein
VQPNKKDVMLWQDNGWHQLVDKNDVIRWHDKNGWQQLVDKNGVILRYDKNGRQQLLNKNDVILWQDKNGWHQLVDKNDVMLLCWNDKGLQQLVQINKNGVTLLMGKD